MANPSLPGACDDLVQFVAEIGKVQVAMAVNERTIERWGCLVSHVRHVVHGGPRVNADPLFCFISQ